MAYTPIPSRGLFDYNYSRDINQLQENIQAVIDEYIQPVGSTYVQFTDSSGSFQSTEEPAVLYGGTWSKLWDSEYVFFRTEGPDFQTRVNGLSQDQMQAHFHYIYDQVMVGRQTVSASGGGVSGGLLYNLVGTIDYSNVSATTTVRSPCYDSWYGVTPRIGAVTEPRNRLIRVWRRTA